MIFFVVFVVVLCLIFSPFRARRLSGVASPGSFVPFFGHWLFFRGQTDFVHEMLLEQTLLHRKTFYFSMPTQPPYVAIHSPENLEYVLKENFANFPKGEAFTEKFEAVLGHGIFAVDGESWKKQRKTASQIFTMRALRDNMAGVMQDHATIVLDRLKTTTSKVPGVKNSSLDIQDLYFRFTLDSICVIAFGVDLHCLTLPDVPFLTAFDTAQRVVDKRFFRVAWKLERWLNIGIERELAEAVKVLDAFSEQVVEERKKLTAEQLNSRTDLLSRFMLTEINDARAGEGGQTNDNDFEEGADGLVSKRKGNSIPSDSGSYPSPFFTSSSPQSDISFSTRYLRDIIMNFIIAGRDTTAQLLSWMTYELCEHSEIQQKVYNEIEPILSKSAKNVCSYDDALQMPYLQAVIQETLRLHPSVPREMKHAVRDCTLPDGTFIPAGTGITPLIQIMGMRTEVWGEDALQFKPERWLGLKEEVSPFKFAAFQAGPRTCLGKHMAYLEAKIMMSMLLYKYRVQMVPGQVVKAEVSATLPMKYPLLVTVEERYRPGA